MDKRLRQWLEQNGLRSDATEKEAWDLYAQLRAEGITLEGFEDAQRAEPGEGGTGSGAAPNEPQNNGRAEGGLAPDVQAQIDAAVEAGVRQAQVDAATLRGVVEGRLQVAGLNGPEHAAFRSQLMGDPNLTAERASELIFNHLRTVTPPIGAGASVGIEDRDKVRDAAGDALLLRSGIAVEQPAAGASEFRGRTLLEIGRELLQRSGVIVTGMSKRQLAGAILSGRAAGGGLSSSDFPLLLSNLVNRVLLQSYMEWPQTWRQFCAVTDAQDFKAIHALRLSGSPDLQELNERGEYKSASFSEAGETYNVITKGVMTNLTRVMLINDDLRAFTRIPQLFGVAARRMEGDAVYDLITSNPVMSDGTALFHAGHGNLVAGTPVSSGSLSAGRAAMRKQTGLNGERIDPQPAFLLVPVGKETDAEILLRSSALPDDNKSAGVHNPWAGKLTPVADPHLDAASATAWYLLAHPNQVPTIEVAYLEGEQQPYVDDEVDFDSDSLKIKVRHDFGAGLVDHVGAFKNPG